MVRNWQARVEQADVRRKQAKQKKQLSEDKKVWKQWVHDCIKIQLDQNVQQIRQLVLMDSMNPTAASVKTSDIDHDCKPCQAKLTLQIWTDTKPTAMMNSNTTSSKASMKYDDSIDNQSGSMKKNNRAKSKSFGADEDVDDENEEESVTPRGKKKEQRNRSNSTGGGGVGGGTGGNSSSTKKKAHPRSKEAMISTDQSATATIGKDDDNDVSMCRSYFFTGNCPLMKKKNSCRYAHPNHSSDSRQFENRTLHDAVTTTPRTNAVVLGSGSDPEQQLQKSARAEIMAAERAATINTTIAAAAAATTATTKSLSSPTTGSTNPSANANDGTLASTTVDPIVVVGAMNMVYYIEVLIIFDISIEDENEDGMLPSEQISKMFLEQNLFLGNIVYMAVNGILIFDRYQDGMIYKSEEFLHAIFGEQAVDNVVLCKRDRYSTNPNDIAILVHMPAILLEHICSFLFVESVVPMTQVCRAWYNEIGQPNAPMWKILLNRHDWPYDDSTNPHQESENYSYRWQYHQHYLVLRDLQALKTVFDAFVVRSNNNNSYTISNPAVAVYDYGSRRNIPDGQCVGIEAWSPRRVLLAYDRDCTLRLFESSHKIAPGGEYTNEKHCRELICYRINPYRKTKKKTCIVKKLVLDDKFITVLCEVHEVQDVMNAKKEILITITRDDFLVGESDTVEDNAEHISSNPLHIFPLTDAIWDFYMHNNQMIDRPQEFDDLDGDSLINFYTTSPLISSCRPGQLLISTLLFLNRHDEEATDLLDGRLFLISTTTREIIWSKDCYSFNVVDFLPYEKILGSSATFLHQGVGSKAICEFAVVSGGVHGKLMVGELDSSGTISTFGIMPSVPWPTTEAESEQLERDSWAMRNVVLTSHGIVTTDVFTNYGTNGSVSTRTFVSFYPKAISSRNTSDGSAISEASIISISENLIAHHISYVRNDYLILMCEKIFVTSSNPWTCGNAVSVVVHIPSQREIGQFTWDFAGLRMRLNLEFLPYLASNGQGTLAMESMQLGVIMTGDDVRYHDDDGDDLKMDPQQMDLLARKKKKKAVRSKKDSFRTHNGDRCY